MYRYGFVPDYYVWSAHGEKYLQGTSQQVPRRSEAGTSQQVPHRSEAVNLIRNMVMDAAGPEFQFPDVQDLVPEIQHDEAPNPKAKRFYELLSKADQPLHKGCEKHSTLSAISRLLSIKSDFNISQNCYDRIVQTFREFIPNSTLSSSFYESKRMVSQLGLGYKKIDCCPNGCILYYGKDEGRRKCYKCDHPRYKPVKQGTEKRTDISYKYMHYLPITPRLQRLYMSKDTSKHMTWHHEYRREPGVLSHPSDGEAWKQFDRTHPPFAAEPRKC